VILHFRGSLGQHRARATRRKDPPAPANRDAVQLAALGARRIAVRPAAFPGPGPEHLRITARDPERNARIARVIADAIT
jgi:histidinol-phosphate/aromatic aminotransferase/cobyric acid decarboxylase-like protein